MFGTDWKIVRAMPNTAVMVGEGATVFCLGREAHNSDAHIVRKMFSSVGFCAQVLESQIGDYNIINHCDINNLKIFFEDAVTGVSGSGPAYMYLILEAMADEGVRQGLDRKVSYQLAAQTMIGAGKMVQSTGSHP